MSHRTSLDGHQQREDDQKGARFTIESTKFTNIFDGSAKCLALLVTETFMDQLTKSFQNKDELENIEGDIVYMNIDIREIEETIEAAGTSLE